MEPSFDPPPPAVPLPTVPLPPEPAPPRPYGAAPASTSHPGGWAAVSAFTYGVVGLGFATALLVAGVAASAALHAGKLAIQNSGADVSAADAAVLDRGIGVLTPPLLVYGVVVLALGIAATAAGIGMLRRSERARRVLLVVLGVSAVASVAWCVYSIAVYADAVRGWVVEYHEVSARLGLGGDLGSAFDDGAGSAFSDSCAAGLHLLVISAVAAGLRSSHARAWCGSSAEPTSKQPLEPARPPR